MTAEQLEDGSMAADVPSVPKVRLLLAAAGIQSGVVAAALLLAQDGETLGRYFGAVLLGIGAAGSLFCAVACSPVAFRVSLVGLVVGYVSRAIAVPWSILAGVLDVDPWRVAIALSVYPSMAVLIGLVWVRLLYPVLVVSCDWPYEGGT